MSAPTVTVSGARGRLGTRIVEHLRAAELNVQGLVRRDPEPDAAVPMHTEAEAVLRSGTVLVEAALPKAALQHVALAAAAGVPVCVATTGFDEAQTAQLRDCGRQIPVLLAPNLSLGVTLLLDLVRTAAGALADYHLEVLEMHHAQKRDAPSGTAWALAKAADEARGRDIQRDAILARAGETGARGQHEVGMMTLRGGDVVGEHTVFLVGPTERLELTHRAQTRDAFAAGAVPAVRFLAGADVGVYGMRDVLGL